MPTHPTLTDMPQADEGASPCKFPPGFLVPVIDPTRCEAKGPCVSACPLNVLSIRRLDREEKASLAPWQRLKSFVHGHKRAFVLDPQACQGCGLCVRVCPEQAIHLRRNDDSG